jgi:hypothetical protein
MLFSFVIASEAKQSCRLPRYGLLRRFAPRNDAQLMEARHDFLAQQAQGIHDQRMWNEAAGVKLGEDAVEPDLLTQALQLFGHLIGRADNHLVAKGVVIADGLQLLAALGALLDGARTRNVGGRLELAADRAEQMHDALFGLTSRPLLGLGEVDRHAQIDFAHTGMAGSVIRLVIAAHQRRQLRERAETGGDEDGMPQRADRGIGVDAGGGDADGRSWLLHRLWHHGDLVVGEIFAGKGEALVGPGPLDDLQRLGEALAAFLIGNAVGLINMGEPAAPDAEDEAPVAYLVDGGRLLGKPQRMAETSSKDCANASASLVSGDF